MMVLCYMYVIQIKNDLINWVKILTFFIVQFIALCSSDFTLRKHYVSYVLTTREEYPVSLFFWKVPVRYQSKQWRHLYRDEISRSAKVKIYPATLLCVLRSTLFHFAFSTLTTFTRFYIFPLKIYQISWNPFFLLKNRDKI